jgi:hypothetical protein
VNSAKPRASSTVFHSADTACDTTNLAASSGSSERKQPCARHARSIISSIARSAGPLSAACNADCASVASRRNVTRHFVRSLRDTRRSPAM